MSTTRNAPIDHAPPKPGLLGREYKRPHDGTYLQNWNPLLLSHELPAGKIVGKDFLGTRVILYRDGDGKPVIQSAYCPHLGADLSNAEIVDAKVRCPYHHWKFTTSGACVEVPGETKIPKRARIFNYPAVEKWGLIWAFNGETPLFDVPGMPNLAEEDVVFQAHRHGIRPIEGWISTSNSVDFLHLKTVHGIPNARPKEIEFGDYTVRIRQESPERIADTQISGCTFSGFNTRLSDGTERNFMVGSAQLAPGYSEAYYVVAVRRSEAEKLGEAKTRERLDQMIAWVHKLYSEDEPILFSIRFRERGKRMLVSQDKHFATFLKQLEKFPRAAPYDV